MRALDVTRPPPLATVVEERIRTAIVSGELRLGQPVSEDRLATMLGVSRTPVREALTALQMQGLIAILPQRGSFVFQPSEQDIAELCEYRLMLEVQALRLAYERNRSATLHKLEAALADMLRLQARGQISEASQADAAFHNTFFAHCGNHLFEHAYHLVSGRIGAIRYFARGSVTSRRNSNRQHRAIVDAFAAGDLAGAESVLAPHILNMRTHFVEAARAAADVKDARHDQ
jgi:DNA-binding GntR family transcriptional regulator